MGYMIPWHQFKGPYFTVPNALTISRMILLIPFYLLGKKYPEQPGNMMLLSIILGIVIVGVLTDFLDGFIARKLNQTSPFGQLLDPISDKMVSFTALILLYLHYNFPLWMLVIYMSRELLGVLGTSLLFMNYGIQGKPNLWGKFGVGVTALAVFWYIMQPAFQYMEYPVDHPLRHPEYSLYLLTAILSGGVLAYANSYLHYFFQD